MLDEVRFRAIADQVIGLAAPYEVELVGASQQEGVARFANNAIAQHVEARDREIVIRVQSDRCQGRATTNQSDRRSLERAVRRAIAMAESQTQRSTFGGDLLELPPPQRYQPVHHYVKRTLEITPAEKIEQIRAVVAQCKRRSLTAAGLFSNSLHTIGVANSRGLFAYSAYTTAGFSLTVMTADSSGWAQATHRDVGEIRPLDLAASAIDKAVRSRRPRAFEPGRTSVVLEPAAVAELLLFMAWEGFGAVPYQEGRSFLSRKIGQPLFSGLVTILDDAYHPQTIGIPFDFEGMPRRPVAFIEKGVARGVVYDRKTALRDGVESTGHALPQPSTDGPIPLNLVMTGGDRELPEMIATTERGLLITHFHYTNLIDPTPLTITGMTRDGTFLIEKGRIRHPVKNLRFTESIVGAFNRIEAIARKTVYACSFWGGGIVAPAVRIRDFNFSSTTKF